MDEVHVQTVGEYFYADNPNTITGVISALSAFGVSGLTYGHVRYRSKHYYYLILSGAQFGTGENDIEYMAGLNAQLFSYSLGYGTLYYSLLAGYGHPL